MANDPAPEVTPLDVLRNACELDHERFKQSPSVVISAMQECDGQDEFDFHNAFPEVGSMLRSDVEENVAVRFLDLLVACMKDGDHMLDARVEVVVQTINSIRMVEVLKPDSEVEDVLLLKDVCLDLRTVLIAEGDPQTKTRDDHDWSAVFATLANAVREHVRFVDWAFEAAPFVQWKDLQLGSSVEEVKKKLTGPLQHDETEPERRERCAEILWHIARAERHAVIVDLLLKGEDVEDHEEL